MKYRVEISEWEDGNGFKCTSTVDNIDEYAPNEAEIYADDYNCKSGDRVEVIDNDTDEVVSCYTVE